MPVVYRGVLGQKLTIAQLDGNFQTLVTSVAAATASINTLQTNLASATASISTLQTNLASATASISTLQTNLASATASINTLQTNLAGVTASLSLGLPGTNDFQFIFLSTGVTYSATFSFVGGILATYSTPFAI